MSAQHEYNNSKQWLPKMISGATSASAETADDARAVVTVGVVISDYSGN
jgi:hypothetical protein